MSASEYLPLYQSFTNRTYIRNGRRFDQSEISKIIEKNICCSVILSGLIQLRSIHRTEYIVLPYNIRLPTLWTPSGDTIPAGKRVVKCDIQLWTPLNFEQTVRPNPNLACDRRQISITPRRLYVIILRTFVIPSSTPFNLNDVESGSRRSAFRSQHEGYYKLPPLYCLVRSHRHLWQWSKKSTVRRSVLWPGVHKSTTLWF